MKVQFRTSLLRNDLRLNNLFAMTCTSINYAETMPKDFESMLNLDQLGVAKINYRNLI